MFKAIFCLVALLGGAIYAESQTKEAQIREYMAQDFSYLLGMKGFSDKALNMHFTLYQGYVKNTNLLLALLDGYAREDKQNTPEYAEIKRRLGWEFDGMRLHELYFKNMTKDHQELSQNSALYKQIQRDFGSYDSWKKDFIATGKMRGIGWVVLYYDPRYHRLINVWVGEHDIGNLATAHPILIMDVWEHAYLIDYGLQRADYITAFFNNIDWDVVSARFTQRIKRNDSD